MNIQPSAIRRQQSAGGRFWPTGFTLIEILVVIAIIGILAGLLFPAIKGAITKAKVGQARGDVRAIENAIRQYYTEYGKLPVHDNHQGTADIYYGTGGGSCNGDGTINSTLARQSDIIYILRAQASGINASPAHRYNPRRIVFYEPPTRKDAVDSNGYVRDPWGQVYFIKLDNNYDGTVDYYGAQNRLAIVVSYGPTGSATPPCGQCNITTSGCDDIVSFQ